MFGPAWQTWTSLSIQVPPAFSMSVFRLGQEVSVRSRMRPALTRTEPWQITAAGLPAAKCRRTKLTASGTVRRKVAVGDAAGDHKRVVVARVGVAEGAVDWEGVALVEVVERVDLARLGGDELGRAPGFVDCLPRGGQLCLLYALVRGEKRDPHAPVARLRSLPVNSRWMMALIAG